MCQRLHCGKDFQMSNLCERVHKLFSNSFKHRFPFQKDILPLNGIYILFEAGEMAHLTDRVVRIGTHTGENNLPARLLEHFVVKNKDRSIFRKNVGRALLNKDKDPFLKEWDLDMTCHASKQQYLKDINLAKQAEVERRVTQYIQGKFSFVVIPIKDKKQRLDLESRLIASIAQCNACEPSKEWLGNDSPVLAIKNYGLWQVQKLEGILLSDSDFEKVAAFLKGC